MDKPPKIRIDRPLTWEEERKLVLHVCVPKLTRHWERIAKWIDNFDRSNRNSFYEFATIPGMEGWAILIRLSEAERKALLSEHCKTDLQRFLLCVMTDRLGLPDNPDSPAAMIMRAYPPLDTKSKDCTYAKEIARETKGAR